MDKITPAVVTGGNRGLGLALTEVLARSGLVISTFRDEAASGELLDLARSNERVAAVRLDVRVASSVYRFADQCRCLAGDVSLLINNAGLPLGGGGLVPARTEAWEQLNTHCLGALRVTLALAEALGRGATVVNVSSSLSLAGAGSTSSYAFAKHAQNEVTKILAGYFASRGVRTVAVSPGVMRTRMAPWASLPPAEAAAGILKLVGSLRDEDTGKFFDYQGMEMPRGSSE